MVLFAKNQMDAKNRTDAKNGRKDRNFPIFPSVRFWGKNSDGREKNRAATVRVNAAKIRPIGSPWCGVTT
jgi:hypothetical protein